MISYKNQKKKNLMQFNTFCIHIIYVIIMPTKINFKSHFKGRKSKTK